MTRKLICFTAKKKEKEPYFLDKRLFPFSPITASSFLSLSFFLVRLWEEMARGQQKVQAQQKNAKKKAEANKKGWVFLLIRRGENRKDNYNEKERMFFFYLFLFSKNSFFSKLGSTKASAEKAYIYNCSVCKVFISCCNLIFLPPPKKRHSHFPSILAMKKREKNEPFD